MTCTWERDGFTVSVLPLPSGRNRIEVTAPNAKAFVPRTSCETSYPVDLIEFILDVKGPAYVCDEIMRDEDPLYVRLQLEKFLLGYVAADGFVGKRLLDFGCGSAGSTVNIARILPQCQIVGLDLDDRFLRVARRRVAHYGLANIRFVRSPSSSELPAGLGQFDFVILCAVYEHLLPDERRDLLPRLWTLLNPGGILFLTETPYRFSPIESHTTGLPLINYLPDRFALGYARVFAKTVAPQTAWCELLRRGVRGGSVREIIRHLRKATGSRPVVLEPHRLGFRDRVDVWFSTGSPNRKRKLLRRVLKVLRAFSGVTLVPYLSLAIQKQT